MEKDTKEIVASNLTDAFYSAAVRRKGYLGPERRGAETLAEGQRNLRTESVTPREVFETYKKILGLLNSE